MSARTTPRSTARRSLLAVLGLLVTLAGVPAGAQAGVREVTAPRVKMVDLGSPERGAQAEQVNDRGVVIGRISPRRVRTVPSGGRTGR